MSLKEMKLEGEKARKVAQVLSSQTIFKILQLLSKEKSLDVSTIAKLLELSEPHISEAIKQLEKLQLIRVSYTPGKRGVRKVCELAVEKVTIVIGP